MVINLPHRTDRLNQFTLAVKNIGTIKDEFIVSPGIVAEKGFIGCGKAHVQAMETAFKLSEGPVVIFEDDVVFPGKHKTVEHINKCLQNLPEEWDVLLGGVLTEDGLKPYNEYWHEVVDPRGLQMYIITLKAFNRIKEGFKFNKHIDEWIANNGFKVYVMNPMVAMQRDGYSDNAGYNAKYFTLYSKKYKLLKP
jgi:GR25 family glycosyltransferase involved in LPS biosynthesis